MRSNHRTINVCRLMVAAAAAWTATIASAQSLPVMNNGGFEDAADFSTWTVQPAFTGSFLVCATNPAQAHSGSRFAKFAAHEKQYDSISKSFATTPGTSFLLRFWLSSDNIAPSNDSFLVLWEGIPILDLSGPQAGFGWRLYEFPLTATTANPQLEFLGFKRFGSFRLDDVAILPPPPGDLCANAPLISTGQYGGLFSGAYTTLDYSSTCDITGLPLVDMWYRYEAPCHQNLRLDMCGSPVVARLSLWTGDCNDLQPVGCNVPTNPNCPDGSTRSFLSAPLIPGETYYIRIAVATNQPHNFVVLNVDVDQPINDLCANATTVTPGSSTIGTVACTPNDVEASCGDTDGDVWYRYVASCDHELEVDTCGSSMDTLISLYEGPCSNLTELDCNDDDPTCFDTRNSRVRAPVRAGSTYFIRVGRAHNSGGGSFFLRVAPVPNGTCANAQTIADGTNFFDGRCAQNSSGRVCSGPVPRDTVWMSYTATHTAPVRLETCVPGVFGYTVSVFEGACDDLQCVGEANRPAAPCPATVPALEFDAVAGVTYRIAITTAGNSSVNQGQIVITPKAENDECAGALPLVPGTSVTADMVRSTASPGLTDCSAGARDLWYRYTPACNQTLQIDTCGATIPNALSVYSGTCESLTLIACGNAVPNCEDLEAIAVAAPLLAGNTYYVRIATAEGAPVDLNIAAIPTHNTCNTARVAEIGDNDFDGRCQSAGNARDCSGAQSGLYAYWFEYIADCDVAMDVSLCHSNFTGVRLTVFEGVCGGLTCIATRASIPLGACSPGVPALTFQAVAGRTYVICIAANPLVLPVPVQPGTLTLTPSLAPNDRCANALPLGADLVEGHNQCADTDGGPMCDVGFNDVWYRYTAEADGVLSVATCDTDFDTVLALYRGACSARVELACNDNATDGPCPGAQDAHVSAAVTAGETYLVRVAGANGETGPFRLFVSLGPPPATIGDMNCDGVVTVGDIGPFVLALTNPSAYQAQFPACDILRGDINGDGFLTVGDIGGFVQLLTGQ